VLKSEVAILDPVRGVSNHVAIFLLRKPAAIASRLSGSFVLTWRCGSLWMGAPLEVLCLTFDLYIMKGIFLLNFLLLIFSIMI
jgi:hypothetical protein